ncbi:hypothetical protein F5B22DRAFT_224705 [Xylaria bambusicola]|uniref:uncharacterized protein n=1 Tax=Xylaria bambusicola TaxID=326684 RepID=UPI002007342C|nr:uncharacterized protein F5B22DRAFT_224705 [Xylaria bambusicola]KAI0514610.1 hypothetical protein F5B22DRAFT_224705 [Xylaria bambusicola]
MLRCAYHKLLTGATILYQSQKVLALPVPSAGGSLDLAAKTYNMNRISFIVAATMGVIMIIIASIQLAMTLAKLFAKRRYIDILRNLINCESGAAANAALGNRIADDIPAASSEEELPSSETIASPSGSQRGSETLASRQGPAPMPCERLSRV